MSQPVEIFYISHILYEPLLLNVYEYFLLKNRFNRGNLDIDVK